MFRWNFDGLGVAVQHRLCEALHAVDRTRVATKTLLKMTSPFGEELEGLAGQSPHYRIC